MPQLRSCLRSWLGPSFNHVGFYSLSEDESAKWAAVQEYGHGHFVGVNSEHPMLPKMLAWASLTIGERWGRCRGAWLAVVEP